MSDNFELLKNAIMKAEKEGYKIFPHCMSCVYRHKDERFKVTGYHVKTQFHNDHKIIYVVKDRKENQRFDVIHNLPRIGVKEDKYEMKKSKDEWKIKKQTKSALQRFLEWRNRSVHQKSSSHKTGEVIFSMLLGVGIGYFFVCGLFVNPLYLLIGAPALIYFVYRTGMGSIESKKYKKALRKNMVNLMKS